MNTHNIQIDQTISRADALRIAAEVSSETTRSYVSAAKALADFVRVEATERADLVEFVRERAACSRRNEAAALARDDLFAAAGTRARAEAYELVVDEIEARAAERGGT
jgi:hypothetical protein